MNAYSALLKRQEAAAARKVLHELEDKSAARMMRMMALVIHDRCQLDSEDLWRIFEDYKTMMQCHRDGTITDKDIDNNLKEIDFSLELVE